MSELDRLRHQADEQREDFEEHVKKDDERFEEMKARLDYCCQALEYLVKIAKLERGE